MTNAFCTHFRRALINGLLLIVPVALTYFIVRFLFDLIDGLLRPSTDWSFTRFGLDWTVPGPGLLAAVILIYLVGMLTTFGLGKWAVDRLQRLFFRIPLIGTIYSTSHQLVESFTGTSTVGFQRVILVEFPKDNTWSIGFLTGISDVEGMDTLIRAYIPTAPFPNSGFVIFFRPEDVLDTDLSVPAAIQLVFSGGVVSPKAIGARKLNIAELKVAPQRPHAPGNFPADRTKEATMSEVLGGGRSRGAPVRISPKPDVETPT